MGAGDDKKSHDEESKEKVKLVTKASRFYSLSKMTAPELPMLLLVGASFAIGASILLTSRTPKEKFSMQPKRLMIHNATKVQLYSPTLGIVKPGSHIMISDPSLVFGSTWLAAGRKFLTLGTKDDLDLFRAVQSGHLYLGGIAGVYVYTDAVDGSNPEGGPKELSIANLTDSWLRLEGIPPIPPNTQTVYRGPGQGSGLDLGTKFKDLDGRFQSFQMDDPITRLIFGVVSSQPAPKSQINLTPLDMQLGYRDPYGPMPPGGELIGVRS